LIAGGRDRRGQFLARHLAIFQIHHCLRRIERHARRFYALHGPQRALDGLRTMAASHAGNRQFKRSGHKKSSFREVLRGERDTGAC
jgi:hypothetical protein